MEETKIVGFRCELDLDRRLRDLAARREQDKSKLIRWIIRERLPELEREARLVQVRG